MTYMSLFLYIVCVTLWTFQDGDHIFAMMDLPIGVVVAAAKTTLYVAKKGVGGHVFSTFQSLVKCLTRVYPLTGQLTFPRFFFPSLFQPRLVRLGQALAALPAGRLLVGTQVAAQDVLGSRGRQGPTVSREESRHA